MKRSLFLLATVTLSSALYAQGTLSAERAREIVGHFNPQLLERAAEQPEVASLVDELISSYLAKTPADTLATQYELAALARNFDNSIDLYKTVQNYQQAVRYAYAGGSNIEQAARQHAQDQLRGIYARIWAVSIQNKEALLTQYKSLKDPANQAAISTLQEELQALQTNVGEQIMTLVHNTLAQAQSNVLAEQTARREAANLQIKTKHKKPVAE